MLSLFSIRCVLLLTKKSVRVTLRQSSIRTLILLSTTLVLGFLYGMWYLSRGQYRYFLTANDFTKLSFDIKCSPDVELKPEASYLLPLVGNNRNSNSFVNVSNSGNSSDDFSVYVYNRDDLHNSDKDSYEDSYRNKDSSIDADLPSNSELGSSSAEAGDRNLKKKHRKHHKDQNQLGNHSDVHTGQKTGGNENNLHCKPFRDANTPQGWLSPTDLLFNIIRDGTLTDPDHQDTQQFTRLLTSMMMNGLPLLDIDDYIYLSDFINNYLGETTRKELLNYAIYRDKFGNFLNVRQNQLRIVPNEGMATDFVRYLNESSKLFNTLDVRSYATMTEATQQCCNNVWAVIKIVATNGSIPSVTIRMRPGALPDTRNYRWSPLLRDAPRQESGQLLYFVSGFLSLQLEVQNFLSDAGMGGQVMKTNVFSENRLDNVLLQPNSVVTALLNSILNAKKADEIVENLLNSTLNGTQNSVSSKPAFIFPLYQRAFPTHKYKQELFWHTFGFLITLALVMFYSLPAAILSGAYREEDSGGQLECFSTLPGVRRWHSMMSWYLTAALWLSGTFLATWLFFYLVLVHSVSVLPALGLFLCGLSLVSIGMMLGEIITNADTLVVIIPTLVFVIMLPGLLYFDLAFDVQRTFINEMFMCLLPPSGVALILRYLCSFEGSNVKVSWHTRVPISNTPMYWYIIMLVIDILLYLLVAGIVNSIIERRKMMKSLQRHNPNISGFENADIIGQKEKKIYEQEEEDIYEYEVEQSSDHSENSEYENEVSSQKPCLSSLFARGYTFFTLDLCNSSRRFWMWLRGEQLYVVIPTASSHVHFHETPGSVKEAGTKEDMNATSQCITLKVKYLTKQYMTGNVGVVVLSNISADLHSNSITMLLGSNGAGKSTLMKILSGLDGSYSGTVELAADVTARKHKNKNRRIGWCPQNESLFNLLSPQEHFVLYLQLLDAANQRYSNLRASWFYRTFITVKAIVQDLFLIRREILEDSTSSLGKLDMIEHQHKTVSQLSGGMKRRLSLALAFTGSPSILLLDEPTSGCDSWTREFVRKDILSRKHNCAILVSTHHTDDVEVLADRVWFLNERYLEFDGPVELLSAPEMKGKGVIQSDRNKTVDYSVEPLENNDCNIAMNDSVDFERLLFESDTEHEDMEFSTWSSNVRGKFEDKFTVHLSQQWLNAPANIRYNETTMRYGSFAEAAEGCDSNNLENCTLAEIEVDVITWTIPFTHSKELKAFLLQLEKENLLDWSINSTSIYKSLCNLYEPQDTTNSMNCSFIDDKIHASVDNGVVSLSLKEGSPPLSRYNSFWSSRNSNKGQDLSPHKEDFEYWPWRWFVGIRAIFLIRTIEIRSKFSLSIMNHIVIPFIIAFAISSGCSDVRYPSLRLASEIIGGIGEVCVAVGRNNILDNMLENFQVHRKRSNDSVVANSDTTDHKNRKLLIPNVPIVREKRSLMEEAINSNGISVGDTTEDPPEVVNDLINKFPAGTIAWSGKLESDKLWNILHHEYYNHKQSRWGAVVIDDKIKKWLQTNVVIDQASLAIDIGNAYQELSYARDIICNSHPDNNSEVKSTEDASYAGQRNDDMDDGIDNYDDDDNNNLLLQNIQNLSVERKYGLERSQFNNFTSDLSSALCGDNPSIIISLQYNNGSVVNYTADHMEIYQPHDMAIVLSSYDSLYANITMLTNITADHSATVFLKEVTPVVYSAATEIPDHDGYMEQYESSSEEGIDESHAKGNRLLRSLSDKIDSMSAGTQDGRVLSDFIHLRANYDLESYPLPEANLSNLVFIERGYLGSTIILLYMLIITISSVRFVTLLRKDGVKLQLHLAGMGVTSYWVGNYLFDVMITFLSLIVVLMAVYFGGNPIAMYFFKSVPTSFGSELLLLLLSILSFSFSIVAASYTFNVLSTHQLSSQLLMLLSTVADGVFLKMYLDRHKKEIVYQRVISSFFYASPAFTFCTTMFKIFDSYAFTIFTMKSKDKTDADYHKDVLKSFAIEEFILKCVTVMFIQSFVYISICILIDTYYVRLIALFAELKWYYSAHTFYSCSLNENSNKIKSMDQNIQWTDKTINEMVDEEGIQLTKMTVDANYGSITKDNGKLDLNNIVIQQSPKHMYTSSYNLPDDKLCGKSGKGIMKLIGPHEDIGIFPILDPTVCKAALRQKDHEEIVQKSHLLKGSSNTSLFSEVGDIESSMRELNNRIKRSTTEESLQEMLFNDNSETTSNPDCIAQVSHLFVEYPNNTTNRLSLCDLSFSVAEGEKIALMGMNGGGKSTLFKTLALAQNVPMSGSVSIAGKDIIDNIWDIGSVNGLGYVPQEGGLLEYLTVRQTIKLFTLLRCQNDNYRSDNNVDRFKAFRTLKDSIIQKKYLDYPVYALSGGTRKKLAVQISNINSPSLLLFDECTTGVDPIAAERIIRYLKQINTSQGMLFASHRIDESINLCSKVIMLLRGQRYLYGSIKAFNELAYQFFQVDISLNTTSIKRAERNTSRESFTSLSCEEDFTFSESPVRNRSYSTSKSLYRDAFGHGMENDSYQNSAQGFNHSTVSPLMFVDTGVDSIGNKKESNQSLSNSVNDSSQSTQHYQNVDDSTIVNELQRQAQAEFLKRLQQLCGGEENIERIVFYSPLNARITLEKKVISICTIWKHLIHWKKNDYISKYSFRSMDMEEALSTIIASSQGE